MQRDDDEELWDLLGKASAPPKLSPFFAPKILREIRQQPSWRDRLVQWFSARRLIPAATVAAVVIAAIFAFQKPAALAPESDAVPEVIAQLDAIDFEVVADLDNLLALEEDNLWTDPDVSRL